MSVFYREIRATQPPVDLGQAEDGRAQVVVNFRVVKRASTTFLAEVLAVLEAAGVGTRNVTLFASSQAQLPPAASGGAAVLALKSGGGMPAEETQNVISPPAYERPSLQAIAYASSFAAAHTLAYAAYVALGAVRNTEVTP